MFPSLQLKLERFEELEQQLQDPDVLSDTTKLIAVQREYGGLAKVAKAVREFNALEGDIETAQAMVAEETHADSKEYAQAELDELQQRFSVIQTELEELLTAGDSITRGGLIMEIRAGTGGDEAALFARDLYEMYIKLVDLRKWKAETLEFNGTELGGIKEVTLSISGEGAYHQLQFESGGHRVQRVPETETQGRIHTSAATVAVLPEASEVELNIKSDDLKIDTYHASGPGGQKVNKTESAVRITHLPTGTVVTCQDEKSQHKNRDKALRVLRSRLYQLEREKADAERAAMRKDMVGSGDRSGKIRTYNWPQGRVTDHRLEGDDKNHALGGVLDGNLEPIIRALQIQDRAARMEAAIE